MWTTLLLCCLVALSASEQHDGAWKQDTEYRYHVHTQTLAAIPNLKNQWVGLFTKADLTIRPISKDVLMGKLQNGKYSEWHDSLKNGPTNYQPDAELSYEPMQLNQQPFEIRLNNGAIHSIAVHKDMTNVELNQLKSILSQLQVDIQARNEIQSPHVHLPFNNYQDDNRNQALYKVMEHTVTGKCDTFYDVSRIPLYLAQTYTESNNNVPMQKGESFYEIFKTKNYSICEQRMGYHFGIDGLSDWEPQSNVMGPLTKSAVSRIMITGKSLDKYTIRSSVTTNRVVKVHLDKETQHDSVVVSQVNLTLASMEQSTNKPQIQSEQLVNVGNLVYSYDLPSDSKNSLRWRKESLENQDDDHEERVTMRTSQNAYKVEDVEDDDDEQFLNSFYGQQNQLSKRSRRSLENQIRRNNRIPFELSSNEEQDEESYVKRDYHQPKPTLSYAPENPLLNYFVGNKGRSIQSVDNFNAPVEVQRLTREIAEDLENVNELPVKYTLRKFAVLTKVIRTMNAKQIDDATNLLNDAQSSYEHKNDMEKSRKVYRDSLLNAGTGPAVVELMKWIEDGRLQGEEAAEVIAALPKTIREPTEEMQKRFFDFVKHENIRKQSNVNTTAGIAFTRFMYQAQINRKSSMKYYPVESYGPLSDRKSQFVSEHVVPYFAQLLESAVQQKDIPSTLYAIRALGNLGHADLPATFEPYLNGKIRVSDFQRLAIVLALDKYTINYPKMGAVMSYKMYQNKAETPEIRSAAAFQVLRANPLHVVLERLAEETNNEENIDVRTAVRSALESAARLTNPENAKFAENAKRALSLLKPEKQGLQYARTHLRDYAIREMEASYHQQSSYIVNKDSFIPNGIFVDTVGNIGGFKRRAEFQAVVSSIDELLNRFYDNVQPSSETSQDRNTYNNNNNNNNNNNGQSNSQSYWSAEKIMNLLNLKPNKVQPLEGQMLFNAMNMERFVAFDKQTMERMPHIAKKIANQLRNGLAVDYMKFYNQEDIVIAFPLETGLPFTFNYRTPTLVQVTGQIRARTTPDVVSSDDNVRVPESLNLTAEIDAVYSVANEVTVSFINPMTRQRYAAGYDKKVQVMVPLRVATDVDIRNREIKTMVQPLYEQTPKKVLQMGSWPYTVRDDITALRPITEAKHIKDIALQPIRDIDYTFGAKETGLVFSIQGKQQKYSNQITNAWKALGQHDMTSFALFGQQTTSPEHYSFNVVFDPIRSTTKSTKFTMKYDWDNKMTDEGKNQRNAHPRARGQSADGTENLAVPTSVKPNSEERRQQFLRNSVEGLNAPNGANVVDLSVEFMGEQNYEYVATISHASSKTEGKSRILMFAQKGTSQSNGGSKSGEISSKVIYLQADAKYYTPEDIRQPNREKAFADVDFKLSYSYDNVLELANMRGNIQMKQSSDLRKYLQEQWTKRSQNAFITPNTVDRIDITLDVKNSPSVSIWEQQLGIKIRDIYNYLRYSTYMHLRENPEYDGEQHKISFEIRLSNDLKAADMVLKTHHSKVEWNGVPVPKMLRNIAVVPINWDIVQELKRELIQNRDTCFVSGNEIITFENSTVKFDGFDNAWHLAVHKMRNSGEWQNENGNNKQTHQASVLIRDAQSNQSQGKNQKKEILMVLHQKTHHDITLRLAPQQSSTKNVPRLLVDEQEKELSSENVNEIYSTENPQKVLARVYVINGVHGSGDENQRRNSLRVETKSGNSWGNPWDNLEVTYDGENVQIRSQGPNRNNYGVCGAFTGQVFNELKSPKNAIVNNHVYFVASWAILDEESNRNLQSKVTQIRQIVDTYPREEIFYSSPIPDSRKSQNRNQNQGNDNNDNTESNWNQQLKFGTKHQTQFIEDFDQQEICFSQRPLPACPKGYRVNGSFVKNVPVVCRNINDKSAQYYKEQLQHGKTINMTNHHADKMVKFSLPKRCERA